MPPMPKALTRGPMAVRFEVRASNALWQFDVSHSDLKEIEQPARIAPGRRGPPVPMLFSVVDDRSGVAFQEYRCVYGEDVDFPELWCWEAFFVCSAQANFR